MMKVVQTAWVIFVTIALLLYIAGAFVYYAQLKQVCTGPPLQCGQYDFPTAVGVSQLEAVGLSHDVYALLRVGFRVMFGLVPIGLGLLIFARRRDEPFALLVSLFLVTFGMAGEPLSVLGETFPALGWMTTLIQYIGIISLPLFFGLFPNGRMVPRIYWLVVIFFVGAYALGQILQWDMVNDPIAGLIGYVMWLSVLLGGVAAQVYRYVRVSTFEEKRQTRWVLFGLGLMAALLVTFLVLAGTAGDNTMGTSEDRDLVRRFGFLLFLNLPFEVIYLSIGMAVLRSRLFDIDVIIRRTLTYGLVTALLLVVFFGSVILLQRLFAGLTGSGQNEIVTVLSTLAIAALFVPVRNWIQDAIDRRFNRKKYDAQQVLADFAKTARDETDLEKLTARLMQVVDETMEPKSVSLWLKRTGEGKRQKER